MFTNPTLLWGLLFALIPLVIHLINLLRHRQVEWSAMEFLLAAYRKHRTRVRMKELLLLFMRMALIVLLVLMLAGPVVHSFLPGGTKTHHIVILDDSFSMADRVGESSAFENAKNSAQNLIKELTQQSGSHNLTILRTSQTVDAQQKPDLHEQRVSRSFRDSFHSLDALSVSHVSGDLTETLRTAAELAPDVDGGTRILYILSDFRSKDWKENPALTQQLEALARDGFRLRLIDCVPAEHANLGVSALQPEEGTQAAGVPLLMSVQVTNFGLSSAQNVVLHPEILSFGCSSAQAFQSENSESSAVMVNSSGTQALPAVTIPEIPAGETLRVTFPVTFPLAGIHGVRVTLPPDNIPDDNQVCASLSIPSFESVLIIDDSLDGSTSRFLRTALAPGDRIRTGIAPRVENARFLSTNDLKTFQGIYLVDTARLEPQAIAALELYVQNGGGLCVFTGPHTDPFMTQKWYRNGNGFFPVVLDQTEELPPYYAAPDLRVAPHPIFRVFSGDRTTQFNTIHVERYFSLDDASLESLIPLQDETTMSQQLARKRKKANSELADSDESSNSDGDVHVIAALRNNSPLVLERTYGKGKVIVFLTSADREWTDWPVGNPSRPNPFAQGSFVVMVLQLQAYLAREPFAAQSVGETLSVHFSAGQFEPLVSFLNPDASLWERVAAVTRKDGSLEAVTPRTKGPGLFQAELKGLSQTGETRLFAVNVDVSEGATQKVTREELATGLRKLNFDFTAAENFRFLASDAARSILSDWILFFALIWMILEMILAASASCHLNGTLRSNRGGEKK